MIVDCHTHISFDADDFELSEHLTAVETVDMCIVLASAEGTSEQSNKKLADYTSKYKQKLVGFAVVDPCKDKISEENLQNFKNKQGFKGAVLYCSASGFHPAHTRAMKFYELAQELSFPVFFHNGSVNLKTDTILEYAQPYLIDEIAREFPLLKIIIGSMGIPFIEQTLSMVAKHKNVYADLTIRPKNIWQTYNIVVAAYEYGVMDKLLFGSGFPSCKSGQCIETLLGFNMLLADTNLPTVPRGSIRNVIERDSLALLGIRDSTTNINAEKKHKTK
jgi:predicted TIM-barrel fold metal-dependent hydrolase